MTRPSQQVGTTDLSPFIIRYTHHRCFQYVWMISELCFNFRGVHIFTARYVHVLEPADDIVITVLILTAKIPASQPAIFGVGTGGCLRAEPVSTLEPLKIPIHYDFASSLCYVTHRVIERVTPRFRGCDDTPPVEFTWSPLDLAGLLNWKRGATVDASRMTNVERVVRELEVPTRVPETWLDSRKAMAAAISLSDPAREAAWRERVFTAIFEEGRSCDAAGEVESWGADLGLEFSDAALETGLEELERRTRAAADLMVTGVPTFMLAEWPMGGIQDDETMVSLIKRFARRRRERTASPQ
jgi:predicted DsbA family dithiol-disulfide isomerase